MKKLILSLVLLTSSCIFAMEKDGLTESIYKDAFEDNNITLDTFDLAAKLYEFDTDFAHKNILLLFDTSIKRSIEQINQSESNSTHKEIINNIISLLTSEHINKLSENDKKLSFTRIRNAAHKHRVLRKNSKLFTLIPNMPKDNL